MSEKLPEWLQIPYINNGYIQPSGHSYVTCLVLLFFLHNQTVNIWSLVGNLILSIYLYLRYSNKNHLHVFFVFMMAFLMHTPFAIANHLFRYIDEFNRVFWKRMDMVLISIASVLLTYSLSYFVFPLQWTCFFTLVSLCLCIHSIYTLYQKSIHNNQQRILLHFIGSIVIFNIPIVYSIFKQSESAIVFACIGIIVCMTLTAIVYTKAFPEKYFPNTFDIFGASHQLMHVGLIIVHVLQFFVIYRLSLQSHGT
jgi:adiponectin receptor